MTAEATVGSIMSTRVLKIEMDEKIQDAVVSMEKSGVHKILVLDKGVPMGMLDYWTATDLDPTNTLRSALGEKGVQLSPIRTVQSDEPVSAIVKERGVTAFVVVDRARPKEIVGIVTPPDVAKAF